MLTRVFIQSRNHSPQISQVPQLPMRLEQSLTTQLTKHGATIEDIPAIEHLQLGAEHVTGVCTSHGTLYTADAYVAAVNPNTISSFLPERLLARFSSFHHINHTSFVSTVTVKMLSYNTINKPKLIFHGGRFSWTVYHPFPVSKKPASLFSCVSTGDPDFLSESDEYIQSCAMETLHDIVPNFTPLQEGLHPYCHIQRQPLGYVPHVPGEESSRPANQTPIRNFLLAGSWTDTGASTEMESAIASGELCAQAVIKQHGTRD